MARIKEIVGCENRGKYALVHAILEDGTEVQIYNGGNVEVFFDHGVVKAFVKKTKA